MLWLFCSDKNYVIGHRGCWYIRSRNPQSKCMYWTPNFIVNIFTYRISLQSLMTSSNFCVPISFDCLVFLCSNRALMTIYFGNTQVTQINPTQSRLNFRLGHSQMKDTKLFVLPLFSMRIDINKKSISFCKLYCDFLNLNWEFVTQTYRR